MANLSLEEKMRLARAGDKRVYASLLQELSIIIRHYLYKRLGQNDEVEDVLQESLMAIHKASHTYNSDRDLKPWVYSIASHKLNDYLRRHYNKNKHIVDIDDSEQFHYEDYRDDQENKDAVQNILSTLPDKQRYIVYKMKIEGYSISDVAGDLNMSVSAVKVMAHRAYKKLSENAQDGNVQ